MKKYYFKSIFRSLIYLLISIVLTALIVLCCFADEINYGVIFVIIFLSISVKSLDETKEVCYNTVTTQKLNIMVGRSLYFYMVKMLTSFSASSTGR